MCVCLILGPVGGSSDVFSLLTVFEWLQEHSCVPSVPRAQPSHVHSHYTLTVSNPSFGMGPPALSHIWRKDYIWLNMAEFHLLETSPDTAICTCLAVVSCVYKLSTKGLCGAVASSVHWLMSCKARRRAAFPSSRQHDASESPRSRSKEGPETQRHKGDRSSR